MKLSLAGLYSLSLALIATSVNAQIIPDGSLSTTVQQTGNITEINGGRQAGSNLFHSFQDFSVSTNNTAFFNNGINIENILSRVTGGNISNIDGALRANGDANLFLINPAGIVFGENARLDIGGSFLGSASTGLLFDDGTEFSAVSTAAPVLTINAPIGLNFRDTTGDISNRGNLNSQENLTLTANNLDLQGQLTAGENLTLEALNNLTVRDGIDNPFIATAGNELSLQGGNIDISVLNNSASGLFSRGDLILRSDRPINGDAHYYSGGDFRVEQLDNTPGSLISVQDPVVRSQGDVSFADYTGASLHILAGGNVTVAGDLNITGVDDTNNSLQETVTLSNGRAVNINGNTQPTLDIRAGVNNIATPGVLGDVIASESTDTPTGSSININGTVNNFGGKVFLTNQYQPNKELPGGDITVTAIDTSNTLGNGGDVTVDSRNNINVPNGINTASIVDSSLVTVAIPPFTDATITSGNGGAIALFAVENIATGDFNTAAGINLNLISEVDTIEEANTDFLFPFANLQVGRGGRINLQAGNNINIGNLTSSSTVSVNSDSNPIDSFSIIGAVLELNIADGGNINLQAGENITAQNINSRVSVSDRFTSNTETTPNLTLSVSELFLDIAPGNLGSGGNIFLQSGDQINTASLNSSVTVNSRVNNTATILANDPTVATAERPSRAISTIDISYSNINLERGGTISLASDRANLGDVDSSIGVTSESIAFSEANAENSAAVNSVANNQVNLNVTGDRPGEISFDVSNNLNLESLNAEANTNGINNLDSQAISNGENAIANATTNNLIGEPSINQIEFDSAVNFALIRFDLNLPDTDLVFSKIPAISQNNIQPVDFNSCPTNANRLDSQPQAIETAQGKIYPAMGVAIKNGQVRLTAQPSPNTNTRKSMPLNFCISGD